MREMDIFMENKAKSLLAPNTSSHLPFSHGLQLRARVHYIYYIYALYRMESGVRFPNLIRSSPMAIHTSSLTRVSRLAYTP